MIRFLTRVPHEGSSRRFLTVVLAVTLLTSATAFAQAVGGPEKGRSVAGTAVRFSGCLSSGDPKASQTVDGVVYGRERP